jgi:UDP:flavonoid glycosyltransferase YjiC (YdhE family)
MTLADAFDTIALPELPNLRVERFVSHSAVLPHLDTVVCHGGMGIVGKAMAAGVPMAVVPFGRDQPEIARRVVVSGAGVSVKAKRLTPERLRDAVRAARGLRDGATRAAATMAAHDAPAAFADAALTLVARNGSGNGAPRASTAR